MPPEQVLDDDIQVLGSRPISHAPAVYGQIPPDAALYHHHTITPNPPIPPFRAESTHAPLAVTQPNRPAEAVRPPLVETQGNRPAEVPTVRRYFCPLHRKHKQTN